MEQKLDKLTDVLTVMQQAFFNKEVADKTGKSIIAQDQLLDSKGAVVIAAESETTIYRNAVEHGNENNVMQSLDLAVEQQGIQELDINKRVSTSSEDEAVNTSDELMDPCGIDKLISGQLAAAYDGVQKDGGQQSARRLKHQLAVEPGPSDQADQMVWEADANKARLSATPGETNSDFNRCLHSAFMDEEYLVIGSHIDESLCMKIVNHEYVDFARLLPHDRVSQEEDQRMELVNRNGMTYWAPMVDKELCSITSFAKWEVAFRVFSNIYTTRYPQKSSELIQYCHVIHTASLTYVWENVYFYDKEFHIHMARHPQHSWAIILQQAWNLRLKDKLKHESFLDRGCNKSKEICKHFNRGKCHSGMACHYGQRCLNCGKFGHGAHICRNKKQEFLYFPVKTSNVQEIQASRRDDRQSSGGHPRQK